MLHSIQACARNKLCCASKVLLLQKLHKSSTWILLFTNWKMLRSSISASLLRVEALCYFDFGASFHSKEHFWVEHFCSTFLHGGGQVLYVQNKTFCHQILMIDHSMDKKFEISQKCFFFIKKSCSNRSIFLEK